MCTAVPGLIVRFVKYGRYATEKETIRRATGWRRGEEPVSMYGKVEESAKRDGFLSRRYKSLFAFSCAQAVKHALYIQTKKKRRPMVCSFLG
jgi:hypothetical protein